MIAANGTYSATGSTFTSTGSTITIYADDYFPNETQPGGNPPSYEQIIEQVDLDPHPVPPPNTIKIFSKPTQRKFAPIVIRRNRARFGGIGIANFRKVN